MMGIDQFSAIINPPEGAILAVGAVVEKPVVTDHRVEILLTCELWRSADCRWWMALSASCCDLQSYSGKSCLLGVLTGCWSKRVDDSTASTAIQWPTTRPPAKRVASFCTPKSALTFHESSDLTHQPAYIYGPE